jgi:hypothetical protein
VEQQAGEQQGAAGVIVGYAASILMLSRVNSGRFSILPKQ